MRRAGFLASTPRSGRGPPFSFLGSLASAARNVGSFLSGLPGRAWQGLKNIGSRFAERLFPTRPPIPPQEQKVLPFSARTLPTPIIEETPLQRRRKGIVAPQPPPKTMRFANLVRKAPVEGEDVPLTTPPPEIPLFTRHDAPITEEEADELIL